MSGNHKYTSILFFRGQFRKDLKCYFVCTESEDSYYHFNVLSRGKIYRFISLKMGKSLGLIIN